MSQTNSPAASTPATGATVAPVAGSVMVTELKSSDRPATMAELKAACEGAPSDFLVAEAEKGSTADQAVRNYVQFQNAQLRAREQELATLRTAPAAAAAVQQPEASVGPVKRLGVPVIESPQASRRNTPAAGVSGDEFSARVAEVMAERNIDRKAAVKVVAKSEPELHRAYLEATNPGRNQRQLIADKYGA